MRSSSDSTFEYSIPDSAVYALLDRSCTPMPPSYFHTKVRDQEIPANSLHIMPKRYKELVKVNRQERWVTGKTLSELLEAYLSLCIDSGVVIPALSPNPAPKPPENVLYGEYLKDFLEAYKNNQEALTVTNRKQIIQKHVLPAWGTTPIQNIKSVDLQKWFNKLAEQYSHETLLKIKNSMSLSIPAPNPPQSGA